MVQLVTHYSYVLQVASVPQGSLDTQCWPFSDLTFTSAIGRAILQCPLTPVDVDEHWASIISRWLWHLRTVIFTSIWLIQWFCLMLQLTVLLVTSWDLATITGFTSFGHMPICQTVETQLILFGIWEIVAAIELYLAEPKYFVDFPRSP